MSQRDDSYSLVGDELKPTPRVYVEELVAAGDQLSLLLLMLISAPSDVYERIDRARHRWRQAALLVDDGAAQLDPVVTVLEAQAQALAERGHDAGAGRLRLLVRDLKAGMA